MRVTWSIVGALVALGVAAAQGATGVSAQTGWIVFSAWPKGVYPPQLLRVQTTGDGLEQITTGTQGATDPAFSPDGKRVVFARLGSGIFVVNLDGSGLHRLTNRGHDHFPVWSPNGKQIAFLRLGGKAWRLWMMNSSGSAQRSLAHAPPAGRPSWSADSKSIFFPTQGALDRVDARTGEVKKQFVLSRLDPAASQAATVSQNARMVAFVGPLYGFGPPDCGEVRCPHYALYLGTVSSGRTRRFLVGAGPAGWSPDGKSLVFAYKHGLSLWPVVGGTPTAIATGDAVVQGDAPPAWQPR